MSITRLGFIGAGNMAEGICRGVARAGLLPVERILAADPTTERREVFERLGAMTTAANLEVVEKCDTLVIAVKPQNLDALLSEIGPRLRADQLLLSICAGCDTTMFERAAGAPLRVVRVMPNLPMVVGRGAAAICKGAYATDQDMDTSAEIFQSAGVVVRVAESAMDAVTAISGCGPAYVYYLVEAMIAAGIELGLTKEVSRKLAVQTALGAGEMMKRASEPPAELRRRVASPGGATQAAIKIMDDEKIPRRIVKALHAAAARSAELGQSKNE